VTMSSSKEINEIYSRGCCLEIGCGAHKTQGFIGLDQKGTPAVDVVANLESKLPFRNESFDTIVANQVVEHIQNFTQLMAEMHRVLKSNGTLIMHVPYFRSSWSAIDPTHVRSFTLLTVDYWLIDSWLHKNYKFDECTFSKIEKLLDVDYPKNPIRWLLSKIALRFPQMYENSFLSFVFPFQQLTFVCTK
jgi:SAM-dependent methyltransferase